jgi:Asp-tRNA(Asn)/Glu-tRNA(Gln) amidotransferase A subunit family amidase
MSTDTEMSTHVTRGELREEMAELRRDLATKAEVKALGEELSARIEVGEQRLTQQLTEHRTETRELIDQAERRMHADFAQFAKAIDEATMAAVSVRLEPYKDLPSRVDRLEAELFPARRR